MQNYFQHSPPSPAPPSPPQQPVYSVLQYSLNNFTVAVQWESPASDGGVGIDSYTLTGAGITVPLSNEPLMATLTLSYNEMHMVSITASNCAGESTATLVTIDEGIIFMHLPIQCMDAYIMHYQFNTDAQNLLGIKYHATCKLMHATTMCKMRPSHYTTCIYTTFLQLAVGPQLPHSMDPWETSPALRRGQW